MSRLATGEAVHCHLVLDGLVLTPNPAPPPGHPAVPHELGRGAYGAVFAATLHGRPVAVKKLHNIFRDSVTVRRVSREVRLLDAFQAVPQVVELWGAHLREAPNTAAALAPSWDLYLLMERCERSVRSLLFEPLMPDAGLPEAVVCVLAADVLLGLRALHRMQVFHRDASSNNVLLTRTDPAPADATATTTAAQYGACFCDFGLARAIVDPDAQFSLGVITHCYKAPEVIMEAKYDVRCDVWSIGVVVCELLLMPGGTALERANKHHTFNCPDSGTNQLKKILEMIGPLPDGALAASPILSNAPIFAVDFVTKASVYVEQQQPVAGHRGLWAKLSHRASPAAIAFVSGLLEFLPERRLTADAALRSPWFDGIRAYIDDQTALQETKAFQAEVGGRVAAARLAEQQEDVEQEKRDLIKFIESLPRRGEVPTTE